MSRLKSSGGSGVERPAKGGFKEAMRQSRV